MNRELRERYFQRADTLIRQAAAEWDELVRNISREFEAPDRPKPLFSRIVDTREISAEDALERLKKRNPFDFWRERMWEAVGQRRWSSAYADCYQGFTEVGNASMMGIYASGMSDAYKRITDEMNALVDEMGKAGVHL